MEAQPLIDLAKANCAAIAEPYALTEQVIFPAACDDPITPADGGFYVLLKYLDQCLTARTAQKEHVIRQLHAGWVAFADHADQGRDYEPVREYGRMSIGCSLLLLHTDQQEFDPGTAFEFLDIIDEGGGRRNADLVFAADVIVRVSRWFQTRGSTWTFPQDWVDEFVRGIWGDIEDLIRTQGISRQWKRSERKRSREKAQCPFCQREVDYTGPLRDRCGACMNAPNRPTGLGPIADRLRTLRGDNG